MSNFYRAEVDDAVGGDLSNTGRDTSVVNAKYSNSDNSSHWKRFWKLTLRRITILYTNFGMNELDMEISEPT